MYNYRENMIEDIKTATADNAEYWELESMTADEACEKLDEVLWTDDSVTGNGSGSYTFNRAEAKEMVLDNTELCAEALKEFCVDAKTIADKFLNEEWEYFDVTIRCYLLNQMIYEVVSEIWAAA